MVDSYKPQYNPLDRATIGNPFPVLRELQRRDPVHWSNVLKAWVVTRYDDCKLLSMDSRFSAERMKAFFSYLTNEKREKVKKLEWSIGLWAVFLDPPDHTRIRKLMNRGFTTSALANMVPKIEELVLDLLDEALSNNDGKMDFIEAFAYPLPALVIMELLGAPRQDLSKFKRWSDELVLFVAGALITEDKYSRAERAAEEMIDYFRTLISKRRQSPGDDMISNMIAAKEAGDFLNDQELIANCILLLFAGHETTKNLLGNGLFYFIKNPDQAQLLRDRPKLIVSAVEEMLRIDGPTSAMVRIAIEDVQFRGVTISKGSRVYIMQNAANRDPDIFPNPDKFDITRKNKHQIGFGYGIHFCIGAPLARLEAKIAFPQILKRLHRIQFDIEQPDWLDSIIFRGMHSMPISYEKVLN